MKIALISFGNEESYGLLFVGGELLRFGRRFDILMLKRAMLKKRSLTGDQISSFTLP